MTHKSAINWEYLAQAKRLQEKLQQYFGLVEQVRAMEQDPELQAALGGLVAGAVPMREEPQAGPRLAATTRTAPIEAVPKRRGQGAGDRLLALAREGEQFNAHDLLKRAANDPDLSRLTPKQGNDHLRRFAQAGKLRVVVRGKRGLAGSMPVYEFVTNGTSGTSAAEKPVEKTVNGVDANQGESPRGPWLGRFNESGDQEEGQESD